MLSNPYRIHVLRPLARENIFSQELLSFFPKHRYHTSFCLLSPMVSNLFLTVGGRGGGIRWNLFFSKTPVLYLILSSVTHCHSIVDGGGRGGGIRWNFFFSFPKHRYHTSFCLLQTFSCRKSFFHWNPFP